MYPVTQAYLQAIQSTDRVKALKMHIDTYIGSYNLDDSDFQIGTTKLTTSCLCGGVFGLGGVFISDFETTLLNRDGRFNDAQFNGATLAPQDGTQLADGTFGWVPLGTFIIDDVSRPTANVVLKASNNMLMLDQPFEKVPVSFPATNLQLLSAICSYCGLMLRTTSFLNSGYTVAKRPDGSMSCRDVVSDIAELAAGFARCDYAGGLEIVQLHGVESVTEASLDGNTDTADGGDFDHWNNKSQDGGVLVLPAPVVSLGTGNRFDFKIDDDPITITGIEFEADDKTYLIGSDYYAIHITDNKLLQGDPTAVLNSIYDALVGFTFLPFTSNWQGNPALQPGDIIQQTDRNGVTYNTIITDSTYAYRGSCQLSAKGTSMVNNGYQSQLTKTFSQIKHEIHDKQVQIDAMDVAIRNATGLIAGALGGYAIQGTGKYQGNWFIADDPDITKAKKVWRWDLGGFGYSENGVDGPYTLAVTADKSIVAAIITANMIRTGTLQSLNGESWLDLDNGAFSFGNGALQWDKTNGFKSISTEKLTSSDSTVYGKIGKFIKQVQGASVTYHGLEIADSNSQKHACTVLSPVTSGDFDGLLLSMISDGRGVQDVFSAEQGDVRLFRPVEGGTDTDNTRDVLIADGTVTEIDFQGDYSSSVQGRIVLDANGVKFSDQNGQYGFSGSILINDTWKTFKNGIML